MSLHNPLEAEERFLIYLTWRRLQCQMNLLYKHKKSYYTNSVQKAHAVYETPYAVAVAPILN